MALILTRKANQSVMIGNDIKVTVVSVERGVARLAFHCPNEIPVHREEIFDKIEAEKRGEH